MTTTKKSTKSNITVAVAKASVVLGVERSLLPKKTCNRKAFTEEEDVFMTTVADKVPTLLSTVCDNEDIDIIELFINLPALSVMACSLTVANIQQHQAGDYALVQTALVQI